MIFSEAITELSQEVVKSETDEKTLLKIKSALNFGKSEVSKYSLWKNLVVPNNELLIIPNYTTGTATATKDSRTVTLGGGGAVASGFQGRYFCMNSRQYEILSVNVALNTLTLKTPYLEDTSTGTYSIWKKWYRVPSDIRVVLPNEDYSDMPSPFEIEGYDNYRNDISGVVSVTEGSNVMTGSGFLDNVFPGDYIKVEANTYRVKIVTSDITIILTNKANATLNSSYIIQSDTPYMAKLNELSVRVGGQVVPPFYGIQTTKKSILPYSYIKTLYDMVNNNDDTELPHYFDRAILDFAKSEYERGTNSEKWSSSLQIGQARLQKLELDKDLVFHSKNEFKVDIPAGFGRGRWRNGRGY